MLKINQILCASSVFEEGFGDVGGSLFLSYSAPHSMDVNNYVNEAAKRFNVKIGIDIICPQSIHDDELVNYGFNYGGRSLIHIRLNKGLVGDETRPPHFSNALSVLPHFMQELGVSKEEFNRLATPFKTEYKEHFEPEEGSSNFKEFASLLSESPAPSFFKYLLPEVQNLYPKLQTTLKMMVISTAQCKSAVMDFINNHSHFSDFLSEPIIESDLKRTSKKKDSHGRTVRSFVFTKPADEFDSDEIHPLPIFVIETNAGLQVQMFHPDEPIYFSINSDFLDPEFDLGEETYCIATTRYLNGEIDDIQNEIVIANHTLPDGGKSMENIFEFNDPGELRAHMKTQGFIEISKADSCDRDFMFNTRTASPLKPKM